MSMKMVLERQKAKSLASAQAIEKTCTAENRGMNDQEMGEFETHIKDAEKFEKQLGMLSSQTYDNVSKVVADILQKPVTKVSPEEAMAELASERHWLASERVYPHKPRFCASRREAFEMGMFFLATVFRRDSAVKRCQELGIAIRPNQIQTEGANGGGGVLVPERFEATMIDLRERYGVFRGLTRIVPMPANTLEMPRRTSGLTAYFPAEQGALTESTKGWDRVNLIAKKMAAMVRYTNELGEDAAINIGDDLAGEIAYAFANKEDECGFNGDGGGLTYGRMEGIRTRLRNPLRADALPTIADIAGLQVGSGNAYSELALVDFHGVIARLPQYADTPGVRWICHRAFYYNVMQKLAYAAGGVTAEEIINGRRMAMFLGYPVEFAQVMPRVEANSQIPVVFGDLSRGSMLGDRRELTIETSREATVGGVSTFETDETAIRGTQRLDINVHDVGDTNATVANQVAGPIVGLITAAA